MISSWFDIFKEGLDDKSKYNFNKVEKNSSNFYKIIIAEGKKLKGKFENIFIGGFSQGM